MLQQRNAPTPRSVAAPSAAIRVLSIPGDHRYVQHAIAGEHVRIISDPEVPGAPLGQWWPSPALQPEWIAAHRDEFDVVHVHFGFESRTPQQLAEWADCLAAQRIPLVVTVHDLQLPHDADHDAHRARLVVVVARAAAVVTLTEGAGAEIAERFGRPAHVVPHPRMVPLELIRGAVRTPGTRLRVGIHLKSLRPNAATPQWLAGVDEAVRRCDVPTELVVHAHREICDPGFPRYDGRMLEVLDRIEHAGRAQVCWVDRMTDAQLWSYLRSIDVSVLPHRWGTHSGWLEECLDLGVVPMVPQTGYLAEQFGRHGYRWTGSAPEADSLLGALRSALVEAAQGRTAEQSHEWAAHRERTDAAARGTHRALYQEVLAE